MNLQEVFKNLVWFNIQRYLADNVITETETAGDNRRTKLSKYVNIFSKIKQQIKKLLYKKKKSIGLRGLHTYLEKIGKQSNSTSGKKNERKRRKVQQKPVRVLSVTECL